MATFWLFGLRSIYSDHFPLVAQLCPSEHFGWRTWLPPWPPGWWSICYYTGQPRRREQTGPPLTSVVMTLLSPIPQKPSPYRTRLGPALRVRQEVVCKATMSWQDDRHHAAPAGLGEPPGPSSSVGGRKGLCLEHTEEAIPTGKMSRECISSLESIPPPRILWEP